MMSPLSKLVPILASGLCLLTTAASAGRLDSDLESMLAGAGPEDLVSVIAVLEDRPNAPEFARGLVAEGWPVQARHARTVRLLRTAAERSQGTLMKRLRALDAQGRVQDVRSYWIVNAVSFTAPPAVVRRVAAMKAVEEVYSDVPIVLDHPVAENEAGGPLAGHEWGLEMINAHKLWALGITGAGTVVCNLDTGVDGNHVALASRWRGAQGGDWRHHWFDPSRGSSFPIDDDTHGTHTMGTMCGAVVGDTVGVAPDAEWIAALTIGGSGDFVTKSLAAFEWAADPDGNPDTPDHPDVISNSWTDLLSKCLTTFYEAIDNCEAVGAAVVFSAGNSGPSPESITSPKNRATTIVNIWATGALQSNETIASFSSRGPSYCDHTTIKPAASAPGDNVRSTLPNNGYGLKSGTSMASPHVAGAIALLKQANPTLDPETVKMILRDTARDLGDPGPDNTYGGGVIDLEAAYQVAVSGYGTLAGRVTDTQSGEGIASALIQVVDSPRKTRSNEEGYYALSLPAEETYDLEAGSYGYLPVTAQRYLAPNDTTYWLPRLAATPRGSIAGSVRDQVGAGLAGADVILPGTPIPGVVSGADGAYQIDDIPADSTYEVVATLCAFLDANDSALVLPEQITPLDLVLGDLAENDMEHGENGWSHGPVTAGYNDEWHLSTLRDHTPGGDTSWRVGSVAGGAYADMSDAGLLSHCMDISAGSQLRFWHWMDAELRNDTVAYDGAIVEVSMDDGEFEQITPQGGYPYTIDGSYSSPFEPGTPCYSGTQTWTEEVFDLGDRAGEAVFRFRFGTDASVSEEGWHVDDVVLIAGGHNVSIQVSNTPQTAAPGETISWDVTLTNHEGSPVIVDVWYGATGPINTRPLLLASDVTLPAGFTVTRAARTRVPLIAPPGVYQVRTAVGVFAAEPWDYDTFTGEVQP